MEMRARRWMVLVLLLLWAAGGVSPAHAAQADRVWLAIGEGFGGDAAAFAAWARAETRVPIVADPGDAFFKALEAAGVPRIAGRTGGMIRTLVLEASHRRVVGPQAGSFTIVEDAAGALICAAVAQITGENAVDPDTLTDVTARAAGGAIDWDVPAGTWALMLFRAVDAEVPAAGDARVPALGALERSADLRPAWMTDLPALWEARFGQPMRLAELAALLFDIGPRTELVRARLGSLAAEVRAAPPGVIGRIDAADSLLPFAAPGARVVSLGGWTSRATGRHYGWNFRAAAGLGGRGVVCMLPQEGTWAVPPATLRFHIDLALLWGADTFLLEPFPPDRVEFAADGGVRGLPAWWPHFADMVRYVEGHVAALSAGRRGARIVVAVPMASVHSAASPGLGPAVAAALERDARDFVVTTLDALVERARVEGGLLTAGGAAPRFQCVVVPSGPVLSVAHARRLAAWARLGIDVVLVGAMPSASPEEGRDGAGLAAALDGLRREATFRHAHVAEDVIAHLAERVVPGLRVAAGPEGVLRVRETVGELGSEWFVLNSSDAAWRGEIALRGAPACAVCDAGMARSPHALYRRPPYRREGDDLVCELSLAPHGSVIVDTAPDRPAFVLGAVERIDAGWTVLPVAAEDGTVGTDDSGAPWMQAAALRLFHDRAEALRRPWTRSEEDLGAQVTTALGRWRGAWITSSAASAGPEEVAAVSVNFHRTFHLDAMGVRASLWAVSDGSGQIRVNGTVVSDLAQGTVVSSDVAALLAPGKNTITATVSWPGRLLAELEAWSADGVHVMHATGPEWRTSLRQGQWRPAFVLGNPDAGMPGPLPAMAQDVVGVVRVPAGTRDVVMPARWQRLGFLDDAELAAVEPSFPLARPLWLLAALPPGTVQAPRFALAPAPCALVPLGELGFEAFAGRVRYETRFTSPAGGSGQALLDLGEVCWCARVLVDGVEVGARFSAPYHVPLPALAPGPHVLTVEVATLSAPRRRLDWPPSNVQPAVRRFTIARGPEGLRSGLMGPVSVQFLEAAPGMGVPAAGR